jgi:hypothetical protein
MGAGVDMGILQFGRSRLGCGHPLARRDWTACDFFRRVPTDTRGGLIIPQIPFLRHGEYHESFAKITQ